MGIPVLPELCPCAGQLCFNSRDTTGLHIPCCPLPDRKALHKKAPQSASHRLGGGACCKRLRPGCIFQDGPADCATHCRLSQYGILHPVDIKGLEGKVIDKYPVAG